jgi:hypothetical protein
MKKKKRIRKPQFGFEINPDLLRQTHETAEILEIPAAQIGRDALRERLAFLWQTEPRLVQRKTEEVTVGS